MRAYLYERPMEPSAALGRQCSQGSWFNQSNDHAVSFSFLQGSGPEDASARIP